MESIMEVINDQPERLYYVFGGAALLLTLGATIRRAFFGRLAHLPGPWYSNFTGLVLSYYWLQGRRSHYVHRLHQKYGPIVRIDPGTADVCDVPAKLEIFSSKAGYLKSRWYQDFSGPFVYNIFSTQDVAWHRRQRRLLSGPMSESSLKTVEPQVRQLVSRAIECIGDEMKARGAADVFKWSLFMATDVIGELSFGKSFDMLVTRKKSQYIIDLQNVSVIGALRLTFPTLMAVCQKYSIPTPFGIINRSAKAGRNLQVYSTDSMNRYRKLITETPDEAKPTLLTKVFQAQDEDALTFDEIRNAAQTYIVAGTDTTANSLTYLLWAVCSNPKVRDTLVAEVSALPDDFVDHDLWSLPYLNMVIEETLRLYSAAPAGLPRAVPQGGTTMVGHYLPPGSTVCIQAYSMHRDPAVFPNPLRFDPSRWENATKAMKDSFMPFGGGSRICLGLHLARMELRLAATMFFRTFPNAKVSTMEGMNDGDMEQVIYFLSSPKAKRCLIQES